jgi:hypothetical protein
MSVCFACCLFLRIELSVAGYALYKSHVIIIIKLSSPMFPPKDPYRNHWTARKLVRFPGVRQFYTTGCWHPGAMEVLRLGLELPSCLPTEVTGLPLIVCNAAIARYAVAQRETSEPLREF